MNTFPPVFTHAQMQELHNRIANMLREQENERERLLLEYFREQGEVVSAFATLSPEDPLDYKIGIFEKYNEINDDYARLVAEAFNPTAPEPPPLSPNTFDFARFDGPVQTSRSHLKDFINKHSGERGAYIRRVMEDFRGILMKELTEFYLMYPDVLVQDKEIYASRIQQRVRHWLRHREHESLVIQAWCVSVSYLTGGASWQEVDEAF